MGFELLLGRLGPGQRIKEGKGTGTRATHRDSQGSGGPIQLAQQGKALLDTLHLRLNHQLQVVAQGRNCNAAGEGLEQRARAEGLAPLLELVLLIQVEIAPHRLAAPVGPGGTDMGSRMFDQQHRQGWGRWRINGLKLLSAAKAKLGSPIEAKGHVGAELGRHQPQFRG